VNKLEDLFSLVHFLGVEPWSLYSYWRTFITVPFESKDYLRALDVVQTILEPLVLRRTKDMKDSEGNPIVSLPEKVITKEYLEMSNAEREVVDRGRLAVALDESLCVDHRRGVFHVDATALGVLAV